MMFDDNSLRDLAARLIETDLGILDVSLSSYNHLVVYEIPRMVNELRPIVWSERSNTGTSLVLTVTMRFGRLEKPRINENQILHPVYALQLCKSYNSRLMINVDILVKQCNNDGSILTQQAEIRDLCIGEIPVLLGSALCHKPITGRVQPGEACYFIVNGGPKVIVSQERPGTHSSEEWVPEF